MSATTATPGRRLIAVALCTMLAALSAAALAGEKAGAAPMNYRSAKFRIEIKGFQKTVQQHHHLAEDECDLDDFSSGTETIRFRTPKPFVVTAYSFRGMDQPDFFSGRRLSFPTRAVVNRSYTNRRTGSLPEECGDNGGGVTPRPPDCGRRVFDNWGLEMAFLDKPRNRLGLTYYGGMMDPYDLCAGAGDATFPWLVDRKGPNGKRGPIAAELSPRELFDPEYRKWISIARGVYKQRTDDWWARTTVRWEVSFTRLGRR